MQLGAGGAEPLQLKSGSIYYRPNPQLCSFTELRCLHPRIHAVEELDDDNLTILDLENILLTSEIVERQRDRKTHERRFVVRGTTVGGLQAEAVVKLGPLGNLFVITVYLV